MNAGETGHPTGERAIGVHRVRWINARNLADECGGVVKFAALIGISKQQSSHIVGVNPVRNIGALMARRIEWIADKPAGWLDVDHEMLDALDRITSTVERLLVSRGGIPSSELRECAVGARGVISTRRRP